MPLMDFTNSKIVQYLADGYTIIQISKETGVNKRTIEKRILTLRKVSLCKTSNQLVANFLRKKIIE